MRSVREIAHDLRLTEKQVYFKFHNKKEYAFKVKGRSFYVESQIDRIRKEMKENIEVVYYIYESKMNQTL